MGDKEKKIVTGIVWVVSAVIGFCVAEKVYDNTMVGYMKIFHKDAYDEAVKQISQ